MYLKSQYYFTFFTCFFCRRFFTFCFGNVNLQNLLFEDKYFTPLHWINKLNLSKDTIRFFNVLYFVYFLHLLLLQQGDTERNTVPQSCQSKNLSVCPGADTAFQRGQSNWLDSRVFLAAAWILRSTSVIICVELSTLIHRLGAHQCKISWRMHLSGKTQYLKYWRTVNSEKHQ